MSQLMPRATIGSFSEYHVTIGQGTYVSAPPATRSSAGKDPLDGFVGHPIEDLTAVSATTACSDQVGLLCQLGRGLVAQLAQQGGLSFGLARLGGERRVSELCIVRPRLWGASPCGGEASEPRR